MSFQAKAIYMHGSDSNRSNREIQQYKLFLYSTARQIESWTNVRSTNLVSRPPLSFFAAS